MQCGAADVAMRDGIRLYTAWAVPEAGGRFPVIFMRTPYAPAPDADYLGRLFGDTAFPDAGYAVVCQHCRGTGGSAGVMVPYVNERRDGLETLAWIRRQDFYNGEIFLHGSSYSASVHYMYLDTRPADIRGAVLAVQACNRYHIVYKNGFLKHSLHTRWLANLYKKTLGLPDSEKFDYLKFCAIRPQTAIMPTLFGHDLPSYTEMLRHPREDDVYWRTAPGIGDGYQAVRSSDIPILFIGGWYDIYVKGMLEMWDSLPPAAAAKSAMIMGPWEHSGKVKPEWGFPCPGAEAAEDRVRMVLNWFDHIRRGAPLEFAEQGKLRYYVMGGGGWRSAARIPDEGEPREFYLAGGSRLTARPPAPGAVSFEYDPARPAAFRHGAHGFAEPFGGFGKQDPPNFRPDVASFISPASAAGFTSAGAATVALEVRSNCPDTAFYVRLCAVKGSAAWVISDSIASLCYELGEYRPGAQVTLRFKLDPVPWRFEPGDRLRLDVSSSNYPTFAVHTNTRGPWAEQTAMRPAVNTVVFGNSKVILPVQS